MPILSRAGFDIDCIFNGVIAFQALSVGRMPISNGCIAFTALDAINKTKYDLIILAEDECIGAILGSDLCVEDKARLLPVTHISNFEHLYSKCGLSQVLSANQVTTPPFAVCKTTQELDKASSIFGFPVLIKVDKSCGGSGVFECNSYAQVIEKSKNLPFPILLQKKIEGKTVDLTAFYQNGSLIHFTYSTFLKSSGGKYGPSSVREYVQIGELSDDVFKQLKDLGVALGAHGFVNVTSIECSKTGVRYIFEADMRPNSWVDYGRYLGNDAAEDILNYFSKGQILTWPPSVSTCHPRMRTLAYPPRLTILEIMTNRYGCWDIYDNKRGLFQAIRIRTNSHSTISQIRHLYNVTLSIGYESTRFFHPLFVKDTYKSIPYKTDVLIRQFFSKNVKPFLSKKLWNYCSNLYKKYLSLIG